MKNKILIPVFVFLSIILIGWADAHPGHGNEGIDSYSALHFLTEPIHLFFTAVIALAIYVVVRRIRKRKTG